MPRWGAGGTDGIDPHNRFTREPLNYPKKDKCSFCGEHLELMYLAEASKSNVKPDLWNESGDKSGRLLVCTECRDYTEENRKEEEKKRKEEEKKRKEEESAEATRAELHAELEELGLDSLFTYQGEFRENNVINHLEALRRGKTDNFETFANYLLDQRTTDLKSQNTVLEEFLFTLFAVYPDSFRIAKHIFIGFERTLENAVREVVRRLSAEEFRCLLDNLPSKGNWKRSTMKEFGRALASHDSLRKEIVNEKGFDHSILFSPQTDISYLFNK